jgi:hypothetical protein
MPAGTPAQQLAEALASRDNCTPDLFGVWPPGSAGRERGRADLEGEQSPWKERAAGRWKRRQVATDSSVEKCPGVDCSIEAALAAAPGNGRSWEVSSTPVDTVTTRGARVAVMRCGCWRGELFEGCEPRRGEHQPCPSNSPGRLVGNASNLTAVSGMQQARSSGVEQTVEVVQNHEGGPRFRRLAPSNRIGFGRGSGHAKG